MNSREKILIGINEIMLHCNNEEAILPWLANGVPDGADEDEIREMANNDDDFQYCVSVFMSIVKCSWFWEDGIYIDKSVINYKSRFEDED